MTPRITLHDGSEWEYDGGKWTHIHPDGAGKRMATDLPFAIEKVPPSFQFPDGWVAVPLTALDHLKIALAMGLEVSDAAIHACDAAIYKYIGERDAESCGVADLEAASREGLRAALHAMTEGK